MRRMCSSAIAFAVVVFLVGCKTRDFHSSKPSQSIQPGLSCNATPQVEIPPDIMSNRSQSERDVYLEMLRRRICAASQDSFLVNEWKPVLAAVAKKIEALALDNTSISEGDFPLAPIINSLPNDQVLDERKLIPLNNETLDTVSSLRLAKLLWDKDNSTTGSPMDTDCMRKSADALRKASGKSSLPLTYYQFWSLAADATKALDGCVVEQIDHADLKGRFMSRLEKLYLKGIFFVPQLWEAFEVRDWFQVSGGLPILPLGIVSGKKFAENQVMYSGRYFYHDVTHTANVRTYFPTDLENELREGLNQNREDVWSNVSSFARDNHMKTKKTLERIDQYTYAKAIYSTLFDHSHEKGEIFSLGLIKGMANGYRSWSEIFLPSLSLDNRNSAAPQNCLEFAKSKRDMVLPGPYRDQAMTMIHSACEAAKVLVSGELLKDP